VFLSYVARTACAIDDVTDRKQIERQCWTLWRCVALIISISASLLLELSICCWTKRVGLHLFLLFQLQQRKELENFKRQIDLVRRILFLTGYADSFYDWYSIAQIILYSLFMVPRSYLSFFIVSSFIILEFCWHFSIFRFTLFVFFIYVSFPGYLFVHLSYSAHCLICIRFEMVFTSSLLPVW
jgi:hypothetical protein